MTSGDYDAVVYDLDGTLVRLDVDWAAVERELDERAVAAGVDTEGLTAWEVLDACAAAGAGEETEALVSDHEMDGAHDSRRLATADELVALEVPAAVCSLNCEAACHAALQRHDLDGHVEAVVGRDTVPERKPDPTPLLAALDPLGVPPERALFVGDSESDEVAADRAGIDFRWVEGTGPGEE